MSGNIIRAACAGFIALLLIHGSASANTVISFTPGTSGDDIDSEMTLDSSTTAFFSPDPNHSASLTFTDYHFINVLENLDSVTVAQTSSPPGADPLDFNLTLFAAQTDTPAVGQLTFNELAPIVPSADGMLVASLTTGQYVLRVIYNSATFPIGTYTGQITATPLPPALLIFGTGLFGMGWLSRYRRKRQGQLGLQV